MSIPIHFAPLQGYADNAYRQLHADIYGAVHTYYTPFIRVERGAPRRIDMSRFESAIKAHQASVPQIIFNSIDEFKILSTALKACGATRIDLNLGCPFPMQTSKGRGAAMVGNTLTMSQVADFINNDLQCSYSIKMRLGVDNPDQWHEIIGILNQTNLSHITLHPRIATQMYAGELFENQFSDFISCSKNPVIWNGDILCRNDIDQIVNRFPSISAVMIGRGLLARPSLALEYAQKRDWNQHERVSKVLDFHSQLFDRYIDSLCGPTQILQKIKPFWEYLEPEIGRKAYKAIKKATSIDKYRAAVNSIYDYM